MTSVLDLLCRPKTDFDRASYEARVASIARSVGTRFSRGNVAVQNGKVLTSDELEKRRERLRERLKAEDRQPA